MSLPAPVLLVPRFSFLLTKLSTFPSSSVKVTPSLTQYHLLERVGRSYNCCVGAPKPCPRSHILLLVIIFASDFTCVCVCVIDGAKARVTAQYWCVGVKPWGCFWEERPFLVKNLYVSFWLLDKMCVTQIIVLALCWHPSSRMTLSCPLIFAATSFHVLTSSSLLTRSMSKGNAQVSTVTQFWSLLYLIRNAKWAKINAVAFLYRHRKRFSCTFIEIITPALND